ncbi:MAG: hypothetical protein AB2A00_10085 [Myxococcota bacterium]
MNHQRAQELLEQAMAAGRPVPSHVRDHARACAECAAVLDRLLAAERALEGAEGLSARALHELEGRLMRTLPAPAPRTRPLLQRLWPVIPALAVAASAWVLMVRTPHRPDEADPWRARGGTTTGEAAAVPALRVLCVGEGGVRGDARSNPPNAQPLRCGVDDVLSFTLSDPAGTDLRYAFVVGRTAEGALRWYHPRPEEKQSVPLPLAPAADAPLPGVRLSVNHERGPLTVLAIFSSEPLTVEGVKTSLDQILEDPAAHGSLVQRVELVLE